jgi:hypothetical protein
MKFHTLTALCTIATALISTAQVPSLINYQGRLTNANGDPVTGSKNFAISIYDAVTGGTLLYMETIGAVTLDDNGVYSFQFGGSGTSNTLVTETVATSDGAATTFQKVLDNSPVVANSVSVTDGTYTWSQSAGSSNEDQFGVAYSTSLRRVTVNYYNGAPAAGRTITATYRYGTSGITGALVSGAEHWMAISVDGTTQGARQRVLAVPFAQRAAVADIANGLANREVSWKPDFFFPGPTMTYTQTQSSILMLPLYSGRADTTGITRCFTVIPSAFKHLNKIDISYYLGYGTNQGHIGSCTLKIDLIETSNTGEVILKSLDVASSATNQGDFTTSLIVDQPMDPSLSYWIRVTAGDVGSYLISVKSIVKDIRINAIE